MTAATVTEHRQQRFGQLRTAKSFERQHADAQISDAAEDEQTVLQALLEVHPRTTGARCAEPIAETGVRGRGLAEFCDSAAADYCRSSSVLTV